MHASVVDRLALNLEALRARIRAAQARSPHAAPSVTLLPVTKSAPVALFPALAAAGVEAIGENRVQAAQARRPQAPTSWTWHGIGHLQRNKIAGALEVFDVFHALDRLRLADALERALATQDRVWPVHVQVAPANDPAKGGFQPEEIPQVLEHLDGLPHLRVQGFMTMARLGGTEDDARQTFCTLRALRDEAVRRGVGHEPPIGLSMGMTNDFEVAVEEGATLVRVGRAVFDGVSMDEPPSDDARVVSPPSTPAPGAGPSQESTG